MDRQSTHQHKQSRALTIMVSAGAVLIAAIAFMEMTPEELQCGSITVSGYAIDSRGTEATLRTALHAKGFDQVSNVVQASQQARIDPQDGDLIVACLEQGEKRIAQIDGVTIYD